MLISPSSFPCFALSHFTFYIARYTQSDGYSLIFNPDDLRNCTLARRCSSHPIPVSDLIISPPHSYFPLPLMLKWLPHWEFWAVSMQGFLLFLTVSLFWAEFERQSNVTVTGIEGELDTRSEVMLHISEIFRRHPSIYFFSENFYFSTEFIRGKWDEILFNFFLFKKVRSLFTIIIKFT